MIFKKRLIAIMITLLISAGIFPYVARNDVISSETHQIGMMVQAVQIALKVRNTQSLQTIRLYGTDSRYYLMIRGWLVQELAGVESQLHASKAGKNSEKFQTQADFLKKAIIAIDLE